MTLTIYDAADMEQGSETWLQARAGIVTASVVGKLITPSTLKTASNDTARGLLETLVAERLTGHVEYVHPNADMIRGQLDEPFARDAYAEHYAPVNEVGFYRLDTDKYSAGYSPDGVAEGGGLLEIKSRNQKIQMRTILTGRVPAANVAQLQMGLFITGEPWIDYLSWCGGMPIFVKRVTPDPRWFEAIDNALTEFETNATAMVAEFNALTAGAHIAPRIDHNAAEEEIF
ncbi:TPA: YqaJ viral recombinase family protein [Shigella flexneri]|nr:YqaJ viral recombinase family protein [Shigella flexneri]